MLHALYCYHPPSQQPALCGINYKMLHTAVHTSISQSPVATAVTIAHVKWECFITNTAFMRKGNTTAKVAKV